MKLPRDRAPNERTVERLAKRIYGECESGVRPWLRLGWDMRALWMSEARASLTATRSPFAWLYFWRPDVVAAQLVQPEEIDMAKGQRRSNREAKKPKQDKLTAAKGDARSPFIQPLVKPGQKRSPGQQKPR